MVVMFVLRFRVPRCRLLGRALFVFVSLLALLAPGKFGETCFASCSILFGPRSFCFPLWLSLSLLFCFNRSRLRLSSFQRLKFALQSFDFTPGFLLRRFQFANSPAEEIVDHLKLTDAGPQGIVLRDHRIVALWRFEMLRSWRSERFCGQRDCVEDMLRRNIRVLVMLLVLL